MIYNMSQYIIDELGEAPIVNGYNSNNEDGLFLTESVSGEQIPVIGTIIQNVQVLVRNEAQPTARRLIQSVYALLNNRYAVELPETTVDSETFAAQTVAAINSIQRPGYIGADENGLHIFSVNFKVTYKEV